MDVLESYIKSTNEKTERFTPIILGFKFLRSKYSFTFKMPMIIESLFDFSSTTKMNINTVCDQNLDLPRNILPQSMTELELVGNTWINYNNKPEGGMIPSSVKVLTLKTEIFETLTPGLIPPTVEKLSIIRFCANLHKGSIPGTIKNLKLQLRNHLTSPKQLPIGFIPPSVEKLSIHEGYFNRYIFQPGEIPSSVTKLKFNYTPINVLKPGVIPPGVTSLTVYNFDSYIPDDIIPPTVRKFKIKRSIGKNKMINSSITHLKLGFNFENDCQIQQHLTNPSIKITDSRLNSFSNIFEDF
eukprot:gene4596-5738_t